MDDDLLEAAPLEHGAVDVLDPRLALAHPAFGVGDELAELVLALDQPAQRVLDPRFADEGADQRVDLARDQPVEVGDDLDPTALLGFELRDDRRGEELGDPGHRGQSHSLVTAGQVPYISPTDE